MSVDLKARAAQAVDIAQNAGAEDAWSTVSQSRDVQFEYRDGNLEKVKDTTSQSLGIRIYAGGRYSSHSTTDLNPDRLQAGEHCASTSNRNFEGRQGHAGRTHLVSPAMAAAAAVAGHFVDVRELL